MAFHKALISIAVFMFVLAPVCPIAAADKAPAENTDSGGKITPLAPKSGGGENTTPATGTEGTEDGTGEKSGEEGGKEGDQKKPAEEQQKPQSPFDMKFMLIIFGAFALMMILSGRGRRKQQKKQKEMLENLKKGDKVITIGGISGSVAEVREKEIVIKTNDSRMTIARWAIRAAGEEVQEEKQKETQDG